MANCDSKELEREGEMQPNRISEQVRMEAARAAYDDRPVSQLSGPEQRVWQEVQAQFHVGGTPDVNLERSLALLDSRYRGGLVDEVFCCSAGCVLLCDPDINQLERAEALCEAQEHAALLLPKGRRRTEMLAGASRHFGTIARRRGQPERALELDRRAWHHSDHPRDLANVLIDLVRCGREDDARQLVLETQLTRDQSYAQALAHIVYDDIDLAVLAPVDEGESSQ